MKVIVIGGGPAGLVASISIKKHHPDYQVILLEKDKDIGSRIKVSGNGRCNFMNENLSSIHYSTNTVEKINLHQKDVISLLEEVGFQYYFDEQGRGYPISESSLTLIQVFKTLLDKYKVEVKTNYLVDKIDTSNKEIVVNDSLSCDRLVVCIGGISYLNERLNYNRIVSSLDIDTTSLTPSLSPLSVNAFPKELENKRVKCLVKLLHNNKVLKEESGEVLFKKDGLSGIVIFNMSAVLARKHLINYQEYQISLDLLPNYSYSQISDIYKLNLSLDHVFFKELANYLTLKNDPLSAIKDLRFTIRGIYEFKNSQVTSGGVKLNQINDDLSLIKDSRIYLGGELLDIDGDCGGYNIGYCMCSGYLIGQKIK